MTIEMRTIFIVDNSEFNRKQVADAFFDRNDVKLMAFNDMDTARYARYSAKKDPDVVFVNTSFPESFSYIQEMAQSAKVVALINFGQLSLAVEAKKMGADEVVFMPADPFQMRQVVNRVLNK